jgi:hypothetical protein
MIASLPGKGLQREAARVADLTFRVPRETRDRQARWMPSVVLFSPVEC